MAYKKRNLVARANNFDRLWDSPAGRTLKLIDQILNDEEIKNYIRDKYPVGKSKRGNSCYDPTVLLRIWVLILMYKWSEKQAEQILLRDILFRHFCGLDYLPVPDHSTISRFKHRVGKETIEGLWSLIMKKLEEKGYKISKAKFLIVDSTIVESVTNGKGRGSKDACNEDKGEQKVDGRDESDGAKEDGQSDRRVDEGAAWVKKRDRAVYGHKIACVCDEDGLVHVVEHYPANQHDVEHFIDVVEKGVEMLGSVPEIVYADKGYSDEGNRNFLTGWLKVKDGIMRKATRGKKLSDEDKAFNKEVSKRRGRVEKFFAWAKSIFGLRRMRVYGKGAVEVVWHMASLVYNLWHLANKLGINWR